jgi:hypothetical protein
MDKNTAVAVIAMVGGVLFLIVSIATTFLIDYFQKGS